MKKRILFLILGLVTAVLVAACTDQQPINSPQDTVDEALESSRSVFVETCPEVGCSHMTTFNLKVDIEGDFVAALQDDETGDVEAVYCTPNPILAEIEDPMVDLPIKDPKVRILPGVSDLLKSCPETYEVGFIDFSYRTDGTYYGAAMYCGSVNNDPRTSKVAGKAQCRFSDRAGEDSISFSAIVPQTATISLVWKTGSYSKTVSPEYREWFPNGPECNEDACYSSYWIDLIFPTNQE